ncbi:MAG TPA: hypothetical protein VFF11_12450 [Candidatus Binatia bacterium]|nr:hypothetical protein [Candidatus Binatia bacterium]
MNKLHLLLAAALCPFALSVSAQDTNMVKTDIGVFEARPDLVIIKGFNQVGSINVGTEEMSVRYKETTEAGSRKKLYGLAIAINGNPLPRERIYVDYSEIDSLINGLDYLIKINDDVTSLRRR